MSEGYTRKQFQAELKELGMKPAEFAAKVGFTAVYMYHWGTAKTPFPRWVPVLLAAWIDNKRLARMVKELGERL